VKRRWLQVDVFGETAYSGNPLAVVLDSDGLDTDEMKRFANWTNLSETAFLLPPTDPAADYRVRIFTTDRELAFAGHPTLGSCHAWLEGCGGEPASPETIVQECGAGLVRLRRRDGHLSFAGPDLIRYGPVEEDVVSHVAGILGISRRDVEDAHWVDNGPGWIALLLADADAVLALRPGPCDLDIGVVGAYAAGSEVAFEVRAFPNDPGIAEDPVTGSLNASLAKWLFDTGRVKGPYVVSQGTVIGRRGRVHVDRDDDGTIWVGGLIAMCIRGTVEL
jgi:PhzF family phenazine biosynthesis protein